MGPVVGRGGRPIIELEVGRVRTRIVAGACLAVLAASACGGGPSGPGTEDDYTVQGALAELPLTQTTRFEVSTADLAAASELTGVERPTDMDPEAVAEWAAPLVGAPGRDSTRGGDPDPGPVHLSLPEATNPAQLRNIKEFDDLAGWSLLDIDTYAEVTTPPHEIAVLSGDVDDSTLEHLPEVNDGVRTVGEGADRGVDLPAASAVSRTGQPIRMAQDEGTLAISPSTDLVRDWLAGPDGTLADHPPLAALAAALDDADVVSAVFSVGADFGTKAATRSTPAGSAQLETRLGGLPERPFSDVGIGWAVEDGDPRVVVAYSFGDEDAAKASAKPLEQVYRKGTDLHGKPLSDELELVEISSEGPVVVVTLNPVDAQAAHHIHTRLTTRDAPFLHR